MSPEVLRGDGYDFKSDIWSLGCLFYELTMLKSPVHALIDYIWFQLYQAFSTYFEVHASLFGQSNLSLVPMAAWAMPIFGRLRLRI